MKKYRILVTGGHLTPALAVIDGLQAEMTQSGGEMAYEFVWLGRKYAQEKNGQLSHEEQEMLQRGIKFIDLKSGKSRENKIAILIKVFQAINQVKKILKKEKFDLLLSFGGYLAIPAVRAAKAVGVPIITHEQTRTLGRANRYIMPLVDVLALSYPRETMTGLKELSPRSLKNKPQIVMTGNPLRRDLFIPNHQPPNWWSAKVRDEEFLLPTDSFSDNSISANSAKVRDDQHDFGNSTQKKFPLLYISGGSQGSQTINQTIAPLIPELTKKYLIIHQVGEATAEHNFVAEYTQLARQNQANLDHYFVRSYLTADELRYFYPRTTLVVSRSGANTVAELSAFQIPTLYIPLATANFDEQRLNAQFYTDQGLAMILLQDQLSPALLADSLAELAKRLPEIRSKFSQLKFEPTLATDKLISLIKEVLTRNEKSFVQN